MARNRRRNKSTEGEKNTTGENSAKGKKIDVVLKIPLQYKTSGEGSLTSLGVKALVDYHNPPVESSRFNMTNTHRNALTCYMATGGEDDRIAVFEDAPTLEDCFKCLGPSVEVFHIPAKDENDVSLPTNELHAVTYIADEYRQILRDMVRYVSNLHDLGKSISHGIFLGNLYYKDGEVKVYGLETIDESDATSDQRDFKFLSYAVNSVIQKANQLSLSLPHDFENLLSLLKNFDPNKGSLIKSHLAILPTGERHMLIKRFGETKSMTLKQRRAYHAAIKRVSMSEVDWQSPFKKTDSHRYGPANDCYWHDRKKDQNGNLIANYNGGSTSLMTYCRNLVEHGNVHFVKYTGGMLYTRKHSELIVMALYGKELLSFQAELSGQDIYENFMLHYI